MNWFSLSLEKKRVRVADGLKVGSIGSGKLFQDCKRYD